MRIHLSILLSASVLTLSACSGLPDTVESPSADTAASTAPAEQLEDGVTMKDGVMLLIQDGQMSRMDKDVTYADGTTVKTNGIVSLADGTQLTLPEGMMITVAGRLQMRGGAASVQEPSSTSSEAPTPAATKDATTSTPAQGAPDAAMYADYSDAVLNNGKTKVLFFHASWCPECKEADEILDSWLPSNTFTRSVYKVDYDTAKELKAKYGVIYQHTFVVVDGQGVKVSLVQGPTDEQLKALLK